MHHAGHEDLVLEHFTQSKSIVAVKDVITRQFGVWAAGQVLYNGNREVRDFTLSGTEGIVFHLFVKQ